MSTDLSEALRAGLRDWFVAARAGETLSARATAELSLDDAVERTLPVVLQGMIAYQTARQEQPATPEDPFAE